MLLTRLIVTFAVAAVPAAAMAGGLAAPSYDLVMSSNSNSSIHDTPGAYSLDPVSLSFSSTPHPVAVTTAFADGRAIYGYAAANVTYQWSVTGPVDDVSVPVLVSISGYIKTTYTPIPHETDPSVYAQSHVGVNTTTDDLTRDISVGNSNAENSFDVTKSLLALSGRVNQVTILSEAIAVGYLDGGTATAYAVADPTFQVDPSFLAANPGYNLEFSDGIGNRVGGVTEPATWAMLLGGFGLTGAALRRRKKMAGAAA